MTKKRRIAQFIRLSAAHRWPGDRMPSESEICRRFGVSRITVSDAYAEAARAGIVDRQQGRGTFVPDENPVRSFHNKNAGDGEK